MKPRIAVFGLPFRSKGKFTILLHSGGSGNSLGACVFRTVNDETGRILGYPSDDIGIDAQITLTITSLGVVYHSIPITYKGGDISYVPLFKKEMNTSNEMVAKDWDLNAWREWNPTITQLKGTEAEKRAIASREIVTLPIQDSYYYESRIDYTEKFQKLWLGLNAYVSTRSTETGDRLKILSLVNNSRLREAFYKVLESVKDDVATNRYIELQQATGLNMSSNILRDEIARSCSVFDFLSNMKSFSEGFNLNPKELDTVSQNNTFLKVFEKYHKYQASEAGIVESYDLSNAFKSPIAPQSVQRHGQMLFHDPFRNNSAGTLFTMEHYFGPEYSKEPYSGQTNKDEKPNCEKLKYEKVDPLFFRYLNLIYEFRCAYFHGSLSSTADNNELARSAYLSLREIYPAILR